MVRYQIENDLQITRMRRSDQRIEIVQRAKYRIDVQIAGDVIAKVGHGRRENRRQPDRINSEIEEIGHTIDDSRQIADSVAIRVLKRPWINLIESSLSPPRDTCMIHVESIQADRKTLRCRGRIGRETQISRAYGADSPRNELLPT